MCSPKCNSLCREEESEGTEKIHGHITSLSVIRSARRLGIATKLMNYAEKEIKAINKAAYLSLHVRCTNRAAIGLYKDILKYKVTKVDEGYYADGEDAYEMKKFFNTKVEEAETKPLLEKVLTSKYKGASFPRITYGKGEWINRA